MVVSAPPKPISTDARPFLKWAGGKTKLLPQYQPCLPQGWSRYHEPFLGGGALFFRLQSGEKPPAVARLTDVNPELINVYRCVRDRLGPVIALLELHQLRHSKDYYYDLRAQHELPPVERAARFIYLNKTCFNGLYRENRKGRFNVPMGRYKNPGICNIEMLTAASEVLQRCEIEQEDFTNVLKHAKGKRDFVYLDPPYFPISATSNFTSYSRDAFGAEQHEQLRDVCLALAQRGVKVMLSNSNCEFVRELYTDSAFQLNEITAARSINSKAKNRGKITELLITTY